MSITTDPQVATDAAAVARPSPYIGPRAFKTGETLYGRDREVLDLLDLLIAERIVLLYSPSGAGKTSLVQAALIPRLIEEGFMVLPPTRVSMEPTVPVKNRYVFSALLALEEGLPPTQHTPVSTLAQLDLADYLAGRPRPENAPESEVLIFDQFEEILTSDPNDQAGKQAFFAQIGAALRDRQRWALFSMREDYVAALSPYLRPLPTRLSNTYRLDLLGEAAARLAAQRPACEAGVEFTDAAARKLIDDLRRVHVQQSEGATEEQLGPYVEPVQLQVVCLRLWGNLPPGDKEIGEEDIAAVGDVDSALSDYYAERVAATAAATEVNERAIRDWCDRELITEQGIRGQVLQGRERSHGLANRAIRMLIEAHLVRSEKRRGATWFELAHDRLIKPVQADNAAWREAHLSPLQRQAALWDSQQRPDGLLLHDQELAAAERWAADYDDELTDVERAFLDACRENQAAIERSRRTVRLIRRLAVGAMIVSFLAITALIWALTEHGKAIEANGIAMARELMAESLNVRESYPPLSLLLALEAQKIDDTNQDRNPLHAEDTLREALVNAGGRVLHGHSKAIRAVAFSPDNRWLATAGDDYTALLWKLDPDPTTPIVLSSPTAAITDAINVLAFSPDNRWLAAAGDHDAALLWDMRAPDPAANSIVLTGHTGAIRAVAFSPDNRWLATASADHTVRLWDLRAPDLKAPPIVLSGHTDEVRVVAFSPDRPWLVTGGVDDTARLWDLRAPDPAAKSIVLGGHTDTIRTLAISPDGRWLVTGSDDSTARLWDLRAPDPSAKSLELRGHTDQIRAVAIGPNGRWLVTGSDDATARLWDLKEIARLWDQGTPEPAITPIVLRGHTDQIWTVAISHDTRWIATGSRDITVHLWDLTSDDPSAAPVILRGHEDAITTVAIGPDSRRLVTGSLDATPRLWGLNIPLSPAAPLILHGHTSVVRAVPISPDGRWLVTASADSTARLWDLTAQNIPANPIVLRGHTGAIREAVISPDNRRLITVSDDQTARVWDLTAPAAEPLVLRGHTKSIWSMALSSDGRWLATGSRDETVRLWDLSAADPSASSLELRGHTNVVRALAFSPDGYWLVSASDDKTARLWDLTAASPAASSVVLSGHNDGIRSVAINPASRWAATASADSTVRLWDLSAANPSASQIVLRNHSNVVRAVAISPDGHWLVSAGDDRLAFMWDLAAVVRNPLIDPIKLAKHTAQIRTLIISSDSRQLITGGEDNTARRWDLSAQNPAEESTVLSSHAGPVLTVGISPDGLRIVTGSQDTTAQLWMPVAIEEVKGIACQTAGRNMSKDEWEQYMREMPYQRTCTNLPPGEGASEAR